MSLRVAYVCADRGVSVLGRGGSSTHVRELARGLAERGNQVTLFAAALCDEHGDAVAPCPMVDLGTDALLTEMRTRMAKQLRASGEDPVVAAELYSLLLNQTLLSALAQRRSAIDVVYERQSLWSFAGLQFAREARIPYVLEINAPLTDQQQEYRHLALPAAAHAIEALLLEGADRVVLTAPGLSEYARARGASQRNLRVIPCGVAPRFFARDRLGCREANEFVVGFVGSLKPWHGLDVLMEAFAQLARLSPQYRLLIVGDGPLRAYIEAMCARQGLRDVVRFAGDVAYERVPEYLAQIDVGVASYPALAAYYFSPLKIWEYAAAGVPIVASASGELPRQFPHRTAALLHPPGSVRKLVQHIERLRHDRELARRLARRARQVAKLHTWNRLAARVEALVRGVVVGRTAHEA